MKINLFTTFSGFESQFIALQKFNNSLTSLKDRVISFLIYLIGWCDIDFYEGKINNVVASHNANFPGSASCYHNDISTVNWKTVPGFNMLFCSSPCQDVSALGAGKGLDPDTQSRSSLLFEVEKAVDEKHPDYLICENVKGEVFDGPKRKNLPFFTEFNHSLATKGYTCYWKVLHASDYGFPQNRPRTYLIAIKNEIDQKKPFQWPKPLPMKHKPIDLFDQEADDKYYLSHNSILTFMEYLALGSSNRSSTMRECGKSVAIEAGDHVVSRTVTALCSNGAIPTLVAKAYGGTEKMLAGCGVGNCSGLFEVWERSRTNTKEEQDFNLMLKQLAESFSGYTLKAWVAEVLDAVQNLKDNQYIRLRKMTPTEALRFMAVPEEYIKRMTHPREELMKLGYSKDQIDKLLTVHGKVVKVTDKDLYHQAGNSIVVDVLVHIYASLLLSRDDYELWYEEQLKTLK